MALLLIGLNHRTTPVELRETLHLSRKDIFPVMGEMKQRLPSVQEVVILSTCNRLEVYAAVSDAAQAEAEIVGYLCALYNIQRRDLTPHLYVRKEHMAIKHLMRVASGLDSMILGEAQILGQVSDALDCASSVQASGTFLHRLFESALHTGKRARTETAISQNTTSVSHAAALLVRNRVETPAPRVVIIGAGEMAELAACAARDHGMTDLHIINRTYDRAQALAESFAEEVNAQAHPWAQLWNQLAIADVVISATGAPHMVLYKSDMAQVIDERDGEPLIMVDVALPRDIEPAVADYEGIICYDIDDLQQVVDESLAQRKACVPQVERIIHEEEASYWQWLSERQVVPVIKDLRREVQNVVSNELEDALNKLCHLDEHDQEVVKRMAHRIMNKVLHSPTVSLRQHAADGDGQNFARVVCDLFALAQPDDDIGSDDAPQEPIALRA